MILYNKPQYFRRIQPFFVIYMFYSFWPCFKGRFLIKYHTEGIHIAREQITDEIQIYCICFDFYADVRVCGG